MRFDFEDVKKAYERIQPYVRKTPLEESFYLGDEKRRYFFKMETFQKMKSFKVRGAANKLLSLSEEEKARGICAVSSGNHGSSVSYLASLLGIGRTVIIVPVTAPKSKVDKIKRYGAEIIQVGQNPDEAEVFAADYIREQGLVKIDSYYDDPLIYAGQGTTALELLEQNPAGAWLKCFGFFLLLGLLFALICCVANMLLENDKIGVLICVLLTMEQMNIMDLDLHAGLLSPAGIALEGIFAQGFGILATACYFVFLIMLLAGVGMRAGQRLDILKGRRE